MRGLLRYGILPIFLAGLYMLAFGGRVEAGALVSVNYEEKALLALTTFSVDSQSLLTNYIQNPNIQIAKKLPVLLQVFDRVIAESEKDLGPNEQSYLPLINHLRLLLFVFTENIDSLSGDQIQNIFRSFSGVQFELEKTLAQPLENFSEAINNKALPTSALPEVLLQQHGANLNEEVRHTLLDKIFLDMHRFYGQEEVYKKIISSLVKPHNSLPLIVTDKYTGKTEFFKDFTRKIMLREYPPHPLFHGRFKNAIILHFEASWLDITHVPETMVVFRKLQRQQKRPLIIIIEDLERLISKTQASAAKFINGVRELHDENIRFIGSVSPKGLEAFRQAIEGAVLDELIEPIPFATLSKEDFIHVTRDRLAQSQEIVDDLGVEFEVDALDRLARFVYEEKNENQSPSFRMRRYLQELAVEKISNDPLGPPQISEKDVKAFIGRTKGLSFSPDDPQEVAAYYRNLQTKIEKEVAGQERMIKEVLDVHRDLMINQVSRRPLRVVGLIGPTGVGKTELAKSLGKHAYGNEKKTLRIEGTAYGEKSNLWKLTGPTIGYKDSDQKGQIIEFLEGAGKEGGIILIDEGEKACMEFWQVMMPLFEEGFVVGGDGRARYLRNHIVMITSNRGDKQIYPKGFETWPADQQRKHLEGFKQDQLKLLFTEKTGEQHEVLFPDFIVQRIDRFVAANQAQLEVALRLVPALALQLETEMTDIYGKHIKIEKELLESFVRSNFKIRGGYRPLVRAFDFNFRRIIQSSLEQMTAHEKQMTLNLKSNLKEKKITVQIDQRKKMMEFEFPSSNDDSFFRDPHIMQRLSQLPELIRTHIIGQEHIINPLVAAVQKHVIKSQGARRAPLAFFNIGPTGVGKTELAKVLALGLLGSNERVGILPMGEINSRQKWANFFGGDIGYQGGDVMRLFEQILRANPQGGVLVLDEVSNVGGQDRALKTELLKLLYNMIDEGRWISPTTSIEYDLSKYVFLLTGNDGQELYHGASDDHLRQTVWQRNNKPERILEILKTSGVPEPLLGRMAALFWSRPLDKAEMVKVAQRFLDHEKEQFKERQIKMTYSKDFVADVVAYSYSVSLGARSVRNFIENAIGGLMAQIEIEAFAKKIDLTGATVKLSFGDSEKKSPVVKDIAKQNGEVYLQGRVSSKSFSPFTIKLGTKSFLAPRGAQTKKQAYATAIHESGHAIVNDFTNVGLKVISVTIDASGGHLGYVNYENNPSLSWNRERVIARVASILAGGLSQQMAGIGLDAGWSNDLMMARSLATKAVVQWGLGSDLKSIFFPQEGEDKPQIDEDVLKTEVDLIMREAYELSKSTLADQWDLILLVSNRLMRQFTLSQEEYAKVKAEGRLGRAQYVRVDEKGVTRMKPVSVSRGGRCQRAIHQ